MNHVDSIIQILAEATFFDRFVKILVRG